MKKLAVCVCTAAFALLCILHGDLILASAQAYEQALEELPRITQWENGNGLDAKGNRIKDCWAYDTVNPSGRYVQFDENGKVVRKQDAWGDAGEITEDYSTTEQNPGKFGFRCQGFEGFAGTVTVTMREKSGRSVTGTLTADHLYEANVAAGSGSYTVASAQAVWEDKVYQVESPTDVFEVTEGKVVLVNLTVTKNTIEKKTKDLAGEKETAAEVGKEKEEAAESGVKQEMEEKNKKLMFFLGVAVAAALFGGMIYKKKHDRYA